MAVKHSIEDLRQLVILLGQLAGQGDANLTAQRTMFFSGLCKLLGGDRWYWAHMHRHAVGFTQYTRLFGGAWKDESYTRYVEALADSPEFQKHMVQAVSRIFERHVTVCRADYVSTVKWSAMPFFGELLKPCGIADLMYSLYPVGGELYSTLVVYRPSLKAPFGARERDLLHFAVESVSHLHRDGANVPGAAKVLELSPRERSVLLRLIAGDSVKQIAASLSVSHHTVNDHLKSLHKRFDVNSRAELLAKFIAREHLVTVRTEG